MPIPTYTYPPSTYPMTPLYTSSGQCVHCAYYVQNNDTCNMCKKKLHSGVIFKDKIYFHGKNGLRFNGNKQIPIYEYPPREFPMQPKFNVGGICTHCRNKIGKKSFESLKCSVCDRTLYGGVLVNNKVFYHGKLINDDENNETITKQKSQTKRKHSKSHNNLNNLDFISPYGFDSETDGVDNYNQSSNYEIRNNREQNNLLSIGNTFRHIFQTSRYQRLNFIDDHYSTRNTTSRESTNNLSADHNGLENSEYDTASSPSRDIESQDKSVYTKKSCYCTLPLIIIVFCVIMYALHLAKMF